MKNQWKIHPEIDAKSMEHLCKINPRKSNAKNMKKLRKWIPKGKHNLWKCDKKRSSKIKWFWKVVLAAGRLFGHAWATQRLEGEVYLTLKGGTPPATSRGSFLAVVPPRKLLFSMPFFASIVVDILATFWHSKAQKLIQKRATMPPKIDPKIKRKRSRKITRKSWKYHKKTKC